MFLIDLINYLYHCPSKPMIPVDVNNGQSINDFISKEDYSVKFFKFDDVVYMVNSLGRSALMAKLDIKHAIRVCPVSPVK